MLLRQERLALGLLCAVTVVIILTSVVLYGIDRTNFANLTMIRFLMDPLSRSTEK